MRHLCAIDDLANTEILEILRLARKIEENPADFRKCLEHKLVATLFFEPSTRTRLSFEAAMLRGGGNNIHHESAGSTSVAGKGEKLSDSIRVISSYVDILVLRHPWEGAARRASEVSGDKPVINAGDGSHEHPTQTLCDLYTLFKKWEKFEGLKVLFRGDLKYGRTVHSLVIALARLGADILVSHPEGLGLPKYVDEALKREYGKHDILQRSGPTSPKHFSVENVYKTRLIERKSSPALGLNGYPFELNAVYVSPSAGALLPKDIQLWLSEDFPKSIYVTRVQKERFAQADTARQAEQSSKPITKSTMEDTRLRDTIIMHPLPRVNEIGTELDDDPRSKYFYQASVGVPVRMALLNWLLDNTSSQPPSRGKIYTPRNNEFGCDNDNCVSRKAEEGLAAKFIVVPARPIQLRCFYCDTHMVPAAVGNKETKKASMELESIKEEDVVSNMDSVVFFKSSDNVANLGYSIVSRR